MFSIINDSNKKRVNEHEPEISEFRTCTPNRRLAIRTAPTSPRSTIFPAQIRSPPYLRPSSRTLVRGGRNDLWMLFAKRNRTPASRHATVATHPPAHRLVNAPPTGHFFQLTLIKVELIYCYCSLSNC